jgi:hypothetical protein
MSEWTTENVRQRVISSFRVTKPEYLGVDSWGSAFDRWLAAHDAEVRAKALEDAIAKIRDYEHQADLASRGQSDPAWSRLNGMSFAHGTDARLLEQMAAAERGEA